MTRLLQVHGLPSVVGLPSEQRLEAGVDTLGFYTYPLLFYTKFPQVSLAQLRSLSVCGSFLFDHVLCLDTLLDGSSPTNPGAVLLSGALYRETLSRLHALFPPESAFWSHFDRYYEHFCQAVLSEASRHRALVHPYSDRDLEMIYSGKAALAKACLAALAVLDGNEAALPSLEASHDAFYVGFQLADDLDDWRLDYARRHYSYPLTRAFQLAGWERLVEAADRPSVGDVGDLLSRSGVVEEVRTLALVFLDRAQRTVGDMPQGSWLAAIRRTRERVAGFRFDSSPETAPLQQADAGSPSWTGTRGIVVPIARAWRAWLDRTREPRVVAAGIVAEQQRVLREGDTASTVGAALCQVGLAVHASMRRFPDHDLAAHIGMSAGELEWCHRNDMWLDALLALSLDDPPELWTVADPVPPHPFSGWVPPAVGRYLGYRMVTEYARDAPGVAPPTVSAVLGHHRRHMVA